MLCFIVALSGINSQSVSITERVGPMFASKLTQGMSITLCTTLVGSALYFWLNVNNQMQASGTVNLINTIVEMGNPRVIRSPTITLCHRTTSSRHPSLDILDKAV
jgi:hypothetical protein